MTASALSLIQPYATLVVLGLKEYETRSRPTLYHGGLYIHASKKFPKWARDLLSLPAFRDALAPLGYTSASHFPLGGVIGKATMLGCLPTYSVVRRITTRERAFGDYSHGRFAMRLTRPVSFERVECDGALGFWRVPAETLTRIARQS